MDNLKFQVGDVVACTQKKGGDISAAKDGPFVGMQGIVRYARADSRLLYGVEFFQRAPGLHTLGNLLLKRSGWWCTEDALEFAEPESDEDITVQNLDLVL